MSKVAIIGAGAAGLVAAYFAAKSGNDVTVFEKNEKSGKNYISHSCARRTGMRTVCGL